MKKFWFVHFRLEFQLMQLELFYQCKVKKEFRCLQFRTCEISSEQVSNYAESENRAYLFAFESRASAWLGLDRVLIDFRSNLKKS